jgi:uncharacterized membrane protein YuzA (DUF378 family)
MADTTARSSNGLIKFLLAVAIIGAINWGLIGFFNFNLVDAIFGGGSREQVGGISRIVYALVGIAGLALAVLWSRIRAVSPGTTGEGIGGGVFKRRVHA